MEQSVEEGCLIPTPLIREVLVPVVLFTNTAPTVQGQTLLQTTYTMKDLVEKLLEEVDSDIKDAMLARGFYTVADGLVENWQALKDPFCSILNWQSMRRINQSMLISEITSDDD